MMKTNLTIWKHFIKALPLTLLAMALTAVAVLAATGTIDSSAAPGSTSSYTLEDLYQRLVNGAAGSPSTFTEPGAAPGTGTMHDINALMAAAPEADPNGAMSADVLNGKIFWSLTNGEWGRQVGSMSSQGNVAGADGDITFDIPDGYYTSRTATAYDSDLVSSNILDTVSIFGVTGSIPTQGDQTGAAGQLSMTITDGYYDGITSATFSDADLVAGNIRLNEDIFGITGDFEGGCTCSGTLVDDRWCDNGDGTVTDMTGADVMGHLKVGKCETWLKDTSCLGTRVWLDSTNWGGANSIVGVLLENATRFRNGDCNLNDGSLFGHWRMPTLLELYAVTHGTNPVRSDSPRAFLYVIDGNYWSNGVKFDAPEAYALHLFTGDYAFADITNTYYVWPVRSKTE